MINLTDRAKVAVVILNGWTNWALFRTQGSFLLCLLDIEKLWLILVWGLTCWRSVCWDIILGFTWFDDLLFLWCRNRGLWYHYIISTVTLSASCCVFLRCLSNILIVLSLTINDGLLILNLNHSILLLNSFLINQMIIHLLEVLLLLKLSFF